MRAAATIFIALATAAGAAAAAPVEASASVTGFQYELVDLDPDDGVAPWIRFSWLESPKAALYHDPAWARLAVDNPNRDDAPVFLSNGRDTAAGQVTPEFLRLALTLWDGSALVDMERIASYSVSPNTRFVFTAQAQVDVALQGRAYANAWAGFSGMFMATPASVPVSFEGGALLPGMGPAMVSVGAESGPGEGSGVLFIAAHAMASSVSPVPEPGQAALLAAGVLLLAGARRRHAPADGGGGSAALRERG